MDPVTNDARMRSLEEKVTKIETLMERLVEVADRASSMVLGSDKSPGLLVKIDRLERTVQFASKTAGFAFALGGSAIVKLLVG